MLNEQELSSEYKEYDFITADEIDSALLEHLNNAKIENKMYYTIFNNLYNKVINSYKECSDKNLKEHYFDIITEMLFASKFQPKIPSDLYNELLIKIYRGKYYDLLFKYYKRYDYINKEKTLVKILVSYIKPSFLFKTDILTPIHLGRAVEKDFSKDGTATEEEIKWLHENCIGDNDFEGNISDINRRVGFFTGTYWAWKNYERLGNPEYFGSFGYRRFLFPNCLSGIDNYDLILPIKKIFKEPMKPQLIQLHGKLLYDIIIDVIKNVHPKELEDVISYFDSKEGYLLEMYIMKKHLFFEFCEWISKVLDFMIKKYPDFSANLTGNVSNHDLRDYAFVLERLTGYYLFKLTQNKKYKYKEVALFEPIYYLIQLCNKNALSKMRENVKKH